MRIPITFALLVSGTLPALAYKSGNWTITTYPSTGPAMGCIMGTNYTDGTRLSVYVSKDYKWGLGFYNARWNLEKNAALDMAVRVDGEVVATGRVKFLDTRLAALPLGGANAFQSLRYGRSMTIRTIRGNSSYRLTGTKDAMAITLDCAKRVAASTPAIPATTKPAPSTGPARDFRLLTTGESAAALANILTRAGMVGFNIDPPKDGKPAITFSLANGTRGMFLAGRGRDTADADAYVGSILKRYSNLCKGEFLSGKKTLPTDDGTVVRQVVTSCREGGKTSTVETTIVRKADGLLLELAQFDPPASLQAPASGSQKSPLVDAAMRTQ